MAFTEKIYLSLGDARYSSRWGVVERGANGVKVGALEAEFQGVKITKATG